MLTFIEQIDNELKKAGSEQGSMFQHKSHKRDTENANKEDEELEQIAGGREAEIEEYSRTLKKIVDD